MEIEIIFSERKLVKVTKSFVNLAGEKIIRLN